MQLIFPDEGLIFALQRICGNGPSPTDGCIWVLFVNDVTPSRTTVLADLTINDTDFPSVQRDQTDLSTQVVASDVASISGAVLNFTNGSAGAIDVYGYVVLDPSSTFVVAAARLDTAPFSVAPSAALPVLPILSSRSQLP